MRASWLLGLVLLATAALYWPGLAGPFLLDDFNNLREVNRWLAGQASWQSALFGNGSGLLGRPLSMASFMFSAQIGGFTEFSFKLGNLIIHLSCGLLAWQVLRRALAEDTYLRQHAEHIAVIVSSLWLLHPLHVSTVLYAVQRMAQLGTLGVLATLWIYLVARRWLALGQIRKAAFGLFVLFPLALTAALLSKETAAVAPALCLVLELAYFRGQPRPSRLLQAFFAMFLLLPVLGLVIAMIFQPDAVLSRYALWDFTPEQRLLTQARVLMDYLGQLLFPRGPSMGLYHDDFSVSTGLLSPPTTLFSILSLVGISTFAVTVREHAPSVFAGWFLFLVAHILESSFLPMDLYFEHRNYLPSIGLLLALTGLYDLVPRDCASRLPGLRKIGLLAVGGFALVLAFATFGRSLVWQDKATLVQEGVKNHPKSLRANLDMATLAYRQGHNDIHDATLARLIRSEVPRNRLIGRLYMIAIRCVRGAGGHRAELTRATHDAATKVTLSEVHAFGILVDSAGNHCGEITASAIGDSIVAVLASAKSQPDDMQPKWLLRYTAAQLYAKSAQWDKALIQAELAWQPTADAAMGAFLAELYARHGRFKAANRVLAETYRRIKPYAKADRVALDRIQAQIDSARTLNERDWVRP